MSVCNVPGSAFLFGVGLNSSQSIGPLQLFSGKYVIFSLDPGVYGVCLGVCLGV